MESGLLEADVRLRRMMRCDRYDIGLLSSLLGAYLSSRKLQRGYDYWSRRLSKIFQ